MNRLIALLVTATTSTALAYPGSVPATARLSVLTSASGPLVATLPARTNLEIVSCTATSCTPTWCKVTAQGKTGWVERPLVRAKYGRCTELSKIGLFDIKKTEASYTPGLDRDNDGIGCNRVE